MRFNLRVLALLVLASPSAAIADHDPTPLPVKPQLERVTEAEAAALVAQLGKAQAALRAGDRPGFTLYAGAPAYYAEANVGARDAFVGLDWQKTLWIRALDKGSFDKAYRLDVLPQGYGHLVTEVRVWLRTSGEFERVELTTRPPAPF